MANLVEYQSLLRLNKRYTSADEESIPEVIRLANAFFAEDETMENEIIEKLVKAKKKKRIPEHATERLIDRKDSSKSWHSQMEDLDFLGKHEADSKRHRLRR
jgi:hypothetical protein